MSGGSLRGEFLHKLPPSVLWEFCRLMDGLSDLDWTRFASAVLKDQNDVRLCERMLRRTDQVMNQWGNRNGRVGELIDLLDALQLFKQRDFILSRMTEVNPPPPLPPPPPLHQPVPRSDVVPPPPSLASCSTSAVMCWPYEEVHAGTRGFSSALQVGEGGFGVVYRACLKNVDCAVKRLRQVSHLLNPGPVRRSFQTEVEKLSKFRHPNIVDLLGFSEGGGSMCLIYSFMDNRSLEDQLHSGGVLTWSQRVSIVEGAAAALQYLHCPPPGQEPLIHGDVKSSNILLDRHLEAKLSDFGLARYVPSCSTTQTVSVGKTATVRGTLAYLPDEYVRKGELCTAVDVYSFGVVLLEVLTGRPALEKDQKTSDRYLVRTQTCSCTVRTINIWTETHSNLPVGFQEVVALACRCLNQQRKKRPPMTEVRLLHMAPSLLPFSSPHLSSSPHHVDVLTYQLSQLGPLEHSYPPSSSSFSSSSSSFSPHPLQSSSLPPLSSIAGPCETDESRGFSQYDLRPQSRCDCRSQSPSSTNPGFSPVGSLKRRLLEKTQQYMEGQIRTPELLSSQNLCKYHPAQVCCHGNFPSCMCGFCQLSSGGTTRCFLHPAGSFRLLHWSCFGFFSNGLCLCSVLTQMKHVVLQTLENQRRVMSWTTFSTADRFLLWLWA
uniref:Protein kinase domain-containing protein n=1 Tax=Oryzias latipes TaxID=8090 RepID=A0A3P9I9N4_ORYLA